MSSVLADTHAVLWFLFDPGQLSARADGALSGAIQAGANIFISVISIIEVRYLVEKGKLPSTDCDDLIAAVDDPSVPLQSLGLDLPIARLIDRIPRPTVPDLPDRIIAATALVHNLPLVTADRKIQAAPIRTIW